MFREMVRCTNACLRYQTHRSRPSVTAHIEWREAASSAGGKTPIPMTQASFSVGGGVECGSVPKRSPTYDSMKHSDHPLEIFMYIGLGTVLLILLIIYFFRRV